MCVSVLKSQPAQYRFNTIGLNSGLSNSRIGTITKDQQGFLWFGTASGLNRFDGYDFKVFQHREGDTTTINDSFIDKVVQGPSHSLWVYTPKGWNIYDPATEKFLSRTKPFLQQIGLPHEWFKTIASDGHDNYWFIFPGEGVYRYNASTKQTNFFNSNGGRAPLFSNNVSSIVFDNEGYLWIVYAEGVLEKRTATNDRLIHRKNLPSNTSASLQYQLFADKENEIWIYVPTQKHGAWWYRPSADTFLHLDDRSAQLTLNNDIVNGIIQDDHGNIWIATDHGGINLIDKKKNTVRYLYSNPASDGLSSGSAIQSIFKDDIGTIWMGTFKSGIYYFNESKSSFLHFRNDITDKTSLPFNDVNCFAEDKKGNLWIGTNGNGLLYFDRTSGTYRQFRNNASDNTSLSSNVVSSLFIDKENKLWIGTYFGGLNCYDGNRFIRYKHVDKDTFSLSDDSVWEIFEDSQGRLWIGTLTNGLQLFDRKKNQFISYRYPHAFSFSVNAIIEDQKGNIWAGGTAGIELYDKNAKLIKRFTHIDGDSNSLSNTTVLDIVESPDGLIWIGTRDGLNLYDPKTGRFSRYRVEDGLPHNTILRIILDHQHNLWLSTPNRLSNVIVNRKGEKLALAFRNYDETDGLQGRLFNDDAAFITKAGELVFGGSNGFNIFMPPPVGERKQQAPLVFTDLQLFNNSVRVGEQYDGRVILRESITMVKELVLNHDQNAFAIQFADLNYLDAGKIHYSYRLEGLHDTWINADVNSRKISFTGLTPGTYYLSVRARDENGIWLTGSADLKIRILPPFWASSWAFGLYAALIIGGLLFARYRILRNERIKVRKQQADLETHRQHELDAMKVHFFTNVSHELKTPLALIITPVEKLLKQPFPEGEQRHFQLIHRNAKRLLNMVDELLDFRKLEMGELKLHKKTADVFRFCREVFDSFSDIAERKNIHFSFHDQGEELLMSFDPDKLERVLFNLLSNAFKFTPDGGSVSVHLKQVDREGKKILEIRVSDTGIGIPEDKLGKIFERFFQNQLPGSMINQGSGIGLSISKEFVRLHGGTIHAESVLNEGSDLIVLLPVTPPVEEVLSNTRPAILNESSETINKEDKSQQEIIITPEPVAPKPSGSKKTILLVEDNDDYRFYIKDNLKEYFKVVEASNGREGWQKALSEHPDLIVSDLNMPELTGIELCSKLRADKRTSFIPFILLTVVSSEFSQLKGLETGANDYITKPFNVELLISKIRNLMEQQDKFRQTYQKQVSVAAAEPVPSAETDTEFVQKALAFVEKNISNPELSVQEMSREMLLGRATLYRKLFELTGQTPVEFIRSIRLQRAKKLLELGKLTVAEIAYEVGFNDPKYFTKVFKEAFGQTPSAYQEKGPL
ncbi:MAG: hybrid sensor histidine kinase/response regulator [Citrobacter freundii]|nr:MAG: hybrid sensor histidine kinase/response regulator [Citrobacter freundii]